MAKFNYVKLNNSSWYNVVDAKTGEIEYAIFSLLDVPHVPSPKYCKHMDLHLREDLTSKIVSEGKVSLLLDIYLFVFNAVLEISHQQKKVKLCKIYSDDALTSLVYEKFANRLGDQYDVKFYKNWIEIHKK